MDLYSYAVRAEIIHYAQLAAEFDLVPNTQGNVSVRDPDTGLILITPHDLPYGTMTPDDLVIVDRHCNKIAGSRDPSFETPVHCAFYRARPDQHALVHTEPVYTNVLGVLGKPIEPVVVAMLVNLGGTVPVMPYMPSGTDAFGQEMVRVMGDGVGVVWANHGLLTAGKTVDEAFRRSIIVEHAARIYHHALLHGAPVIVTHEMHGEGLA